MPESNKLVSFWSVCTDDLMRLVGSNTRGLTESEAARRKRETRVSRPRSAFMNDALLFLRQFKSPLVLILIIAVVLASILGEHTSTFIILAIILLSGILGFLQERKANRALQRLRDVVQVQATVLREGVARDIPAGNVVYGDLVLLNAGDIIPGDCVLMEANDLHVNEGVLTGESFPTEKKIGVLPANTLLNGRSNVVFHGTSVVNGTAKALVVTTGVGTEFGKISAQLDKLYPETAFEKGIRNFGKMIMSVTLILSLLILLLNIFFGKPVTESIVFGIALAVGMAPELLPAIVTITLAAGARRMADKKVIVKRLSSIQNLGSVNVFCSDKTGTLTEGIVNVLHTVDGEGRSWDKVRTFAYLNAKFETGFTNPLDEAIRNIRGVNIEGYEKLDEVPYDFIRKRLSIVVSFQQRHLLITKGALKNILNVCDHAAFANGEIQDIEEARGKIETTHKQYSISGFRTIGLCYKDITGDPVITKDDENGMTFLGFIVLSDPLKGGVTDTVRELRDSGIKLKLITGDNQLVASYVGKQIGLRIDTILAGSNLKEITDEALAIKVNEADIFAEMEPFQKERIVRAFQKSGNVVGYMGDGINDVTAIKTADVGISVDTAVDVAKETADIIFLEKDLSVLKAGILEGRKTFINTLKYIFITTSANFGNMFSVAGASLFLPFLPMLPKQILLLNLLSDLPAVAISSDNVDHESIIKPRKWDTRLIRNFMIVFGIESSLFDFLTFGLLLFFFQSNMTLFQTGWFIESVFTEILILLIIRTQRPFLKSIPGKYLLVASAFTGAVTITIPYLPYSGFLGFSPLPWSMIAGMGLITVLYIVIAETTKRIFFRKMKF